MNEHDTDRPEEIDPAGTEIVEEGSPDNQAEPSDEEMSRLLGIGKTVRALSRAVDRNPHPRQIITERADEISPRKLRWLWPERIPLGKVTVFAGLPGQGKSLATVDIAARMTTASGYPDAANPLPPSEVFFVAGEDDPEDSLVPRLMAAGADLSQVHIHRGVRMNGKDDSLRLDVDTEEIKRYLEDYPRIRLIVIDPISNHLGGASMLDEQEVRAVLIPLAGIAKFHDLAIICVMHLNKKEGLSAIHRVSGAGAFIGVARASWLFASDPEKQSKHLMLPLKNNYAKESSTSIVYRVVEEYGWIEGDEVSIPRMEWLDEIDMDADEVMSAPRKPRSNARVFLQKTLAKGPCDASMVQAAASDEGISERTLDRAKAELGVESTKKGADGWEWSLPSKGASQG